MPEDQDLWNEVEAQRQKDIDTLAKLYWSENTKIDPTEAMGIADTIFGRMGSAKYPGTLQEVVNQPEQFSGMSPKSPRYQEVQEFGPGHPYWNDYRRLAEAAYSPARKRSDFTHYYATARKGGPPPWASKLEGVEVRGAHTFGREKRAASRKKP